MADTFLYHIVHQPNVGLGGLVALDLLLESVSHPDYEVRDHYRVDQVPSTVSCY